MVKKGKTKKPVKKIDPLNTLRFTHSDLLVELQSKYPGLHDLSKKTKHQLLDNISKIIVDRLMKIIDTNPEASEGCFMLSRAYRKLHPHFGDFQLVLDALQRLEEGSGAPSQQVSEQELSAFTIKTAAIDNIPLEKVKAACHKYCDKISLKVSAHIDNLNCEVQDTDNEEEIVRKKVRGELKKLNPFVPAILRQIIMKNFVPEQMKLHPIHMYGEPFLPSKETMMPFLKQYRPVKVSRSRRMYNLLMFGVRPETYAGLMAMDGTVLNGAKLVIRPYDIPFYIPRQACEESVNDFYAPESFDEEMEEVY